MSDPTQGPLQRRALMLAQAVRGEQLPPDDGQALPSQPVPYDTSDADALTGIGLALSGYGDRAIDKTADRYSHAGDSLRALVSRSGRMRSPEEIDAGIEESRARAWRLTHPTIRPPKELKDTSGADSSGMRRELNGLPETKALQEVEAQYHQLKTAAPNATGDVARIYALAKIFDPGGRVTDSDYQAAKMGQGPMARWQAYINEVEGTGILSATTRANMLATAEGLYQKRQQDYAGRVSKYTDIAKRRGLNPDDVVVRPAAPEHGQPPTPGPAGMAPDRKARLEELRRKRNAGVLK